MLEEVEAVVVPGVRTSVVIVFAVRLLLSPLDAGLEEPGEGVQEGSGAPPPIALPKQQQSSKTQKNT